MTFLCRFVGSHRSKQVTTSDKGETCTNCTVVLILCHRHHQNTMKKTFLVTLGQPWLSKRRSHFLKEVGYILFLSLKYKLTVNHDSTERPAASSGWENSLKFPSPNGVKYLKVCCTVSLCLKAATHNTIPQTLLEVMWNFNFLAPNLQNTGNSQLSPTSYDVLQRICVHACQPSMLGRRCDKCVLSDKLMLRMLHCNIKKKTELSSQTKNTNRQECS